MSNKLLILQQNLRHVLKEFNSTSIPATYDGTSFGQYGTSGVDNSHLNYPYNITMSSANNIFVCDYENSRIVKLNSDLTYNSSYSTTNTIGKPCAIMYDNSSDSLYTLGLRYYQESSILDSTASPTSLTLGTGTKTLTVPYDESIVFHGSDISLIYYTFNVGQNIATGTPIRYSFDPSNTYQGLVKSTFPTTIYYDTNIIYYAINYDSTHIQLSITPDCLNAISINAYVNADIYTFTIVNTNNNISVGQSVVISNGSIKTSSVSTMSVSTGIKSLTVSTGLTLTINRQVTISAGLNLMYGTVISYDSGTGLMSVGITNVDGVGSHSSWSVIIYGINSMQGTISTYNHVTGSMTVSVTNTAGDAGTYSNWIVSVYSSNYRYMYVGIEKLNATTLTTVKQLNDIFGYYNRLNQDDIPFKPIALCKGYVSGEILICGMHSVLYSINELANTFSLATVKSVVDESERFMGIVNNGSHIYLNTGTRLIRIVVDGSNFIVDAYSTVIAKTLYGLKLSTLDNTLLTYNADKLSILKFDSGLNFVNTMCTDSGSTIALDLKYVIDFFEAGF